MTGLGRVNSRGATRAPRSRILIIGAGVSGSAAAIRFAHHGCDVTLVERAVFPRQKICGCCLGAAGLAALDAIDVGDRVRQLGTRTHTFVSYLLSGREAAEQQRARSATRPIRLPLAPGVAISRSVLDALLIEHARRQGVRILQPFDALVVDSDRSRTLVRYRPVVASGSQLSSQRPVVSPWVLTDQYDLVVVATGLTGVFTGGTRDRTRDLAFARGDRATSGSDPSVDPSRGAHSVRWSLPWIQSPHGPLGIATLLPPNHPAAEAWDLSAGEIQMICGTAGYVGLVRLPGGEIDIAAALRSHKQSRLNAEEISIDPSPRSASPGARLLDLLHSHPQSGASIDDSLATWLQDRAHVMTAPPLLRRRRAGAGRVVAIGDCAGYVEPLTGEGMTWGIESGLAVADLWQQPSSRSDFAAHWSRELRRFQRKRRLICGSVTQALRSSAVRRVTRFALGNAPWLAAPITRGLATGRSFVPIQGVGH